MRFHNFHNFWPESHLTSPWNAQVKDRLEGKLHELVCDGKIDLKTAQQAIASNWIEAFKLYVSPNRPTSRLASPKPSESPLNSDQVWVNTRSGKYWKPASRYYGKTKRGEYSPKKKQCRKGTDRRTVLENDYGCESQADPARRGGDTIFKMSFRLPALISCGSGKHCRRETSVLQLAQ